MLNLYIENTYIDERTFFKGLQVNETEMDIHKYSQLIFVKSANAIQWRKTSLQKIMVGKIGHPYVKI